MKRSTSFWAWIVFGIGMLYFFLPLIAVFEFSLRAKRGVYSFEAYRVAFQDPEFYRNFGMSLLWAFLTIIISLLLIVPTAYWVNLRMRRWRPVVEFFTLMPFVVPAVVLVFGMVRLYARVAFMVELPILLIAGYIVLSFPYIYRAVDTGLRCYRRAHAHRSRPEPGGWLAGHPLPGHLSQPAGCHLERHLPHFCHRHGRVHLRLPAIL